VVSPWSERRAIIVHVPATAPSTAITIPHPMNPRPPTRMPGWSGLPAGWGPPDVSPGCAPDGGGCGASWSCGGGGVDSVIRYVGGVGMEMPCAWPVTLPASAMDAQADRRGSADRRR
jgi:hypothetical protein